MTRPDSTYVNANGLWEFELGAPDDAPPFNRTLKQTILVPFPLEACLSGAFTWPKYSKYTWYRMLFDRPFKPVPSPSVCSNCYSRTLLHFGAVDWVRPRSAYICKPL